MKHWLFKSEPEAFSIDDLEKAKGQTTGWDGVRNYQARNTLRDDVSVGDLVLYYHSNANPPAIVGLATVVKAAYPDPTAFDPKADHYDPKSKKDAPTWYQVDIKFVEKFANPLGLPTLREDAKLDGMVLLTKGSRLSVQPVTPAQFLHIAKLAKSKKAKK